MWTGLSFVEPMRTTEECLSTMQPNLKLSRTVECEVRQGGVVVSVTLTGLTYGSSMTMSKLFTHTILSPCCIIWKQPNGGNTGWECNHAIWT